MISFLWFYSVIGIFTIMNKQEQSAQASTEVVNTPSQQQEPKEKKKKNVYDEMPLTEYIFKLGRGLLSVLMIWLVGWFGFSYSWILAAYVVYVFWSKKKTERAKKWNTLRFFSDYNNLKRIKNLPSWVSLICLSMNFGNGFTWLYRIQDLFLTVLKVLARFLFVYGIINISSSD